MSPSAVASSSSSLPALTAPDRRAWAPFLFFSLAFAFLWIIVCRHLSAEWSYNEQYNYGWFVPFFALYLFWLRWEDRPAAAVPDVRGRTSDLSSRRTEVTGSNERSHRATALALLLLFLLFPLRLIEVANPDWRLISWAHALIAVGLTLLVIWWMGGRPWLRHFAFPILFFLVSVPWLSDIEQPIILGLMPTVASIATETLSLFGIPAEAQGNLIHINGGVVGVNEACSGMRSLQTSLMIGLLFGELKRLSTMKRVVLVLVAVAIAFIANCGRAFFLVWIAVTRGVPQVEHWHDFAGYAIVGLVFFGCLGLTKMLSPKVESEKVKVENQGSPASVVAHPASAIPAFFLISTLAFLLFIEAGVEAWYRSHERNLQRTAQWVVRWPEQAPEFREVHIDDRTKTILHHDEGRGATWRGLVNANGNGSSDAISLLYFFRWLPGHTSALLANNHRPDVCLPASGWKQTGDFGVKEYPVAGNLVVPFRHFVFVNETSGRTLYTHAFYCVWEDRMAPPSGETVASAISQNPSDWSRSERLGAVAQGRRHLGQQVMEYFLLRGHDVAPEKAEEAFAAEVPALIAPVGKSL